MRKIIEEIMYDVKFIKGHKLQPGWYKILKIFILLAIIISYNFFFGWLKTTVFLAIFLLLSSIVHYIYRIKTYRFTKSWLDFRVKEENRKLIYGKVGKFYYFAVLMNAIVAFIVSQLLPVHR